MCSDYAHTLIHHHHPTAFASATLPASKTSTVRHGMAHEYQALSVMCPRARAIGRISLDFFGPLEQFRACADAFLRRQICRGTPASFGQLKCVVVKFRAIYKIAPGVMSDGDPPSPPIHTPGLCTTLLVLNVMTASKLYLVVPSGVLLFSVNLRGHMSPH